MPARLQGRGLPQGFAAGKTVSKEPFVILWLVAPGPCREPVAWDVAGGSSSPFLRPETTHSAPQPEQKALMSPGSGLRGAWSLAPAPLHKAQPAGTVPSAFGGRRRVRPGLELVEP